MRLMLRTFLKRFRGIIISMMAVTALAVALLLGLGSTASNTEIGFENYQEECGYADIWINTDLSARRYADVLTQIEGVARVEQRVSIPAYATMDDSRATTLLLTSHFSDSQTGYHVIEEIAPDPDAVNLCVEKRYASKNNIVPGQTIKVTLYGAEVECFVQGIVTAPETIYVTPSPYLMSSNSSFGYAFLSDNDFARLVTSARQGSSTIEAADALAGLVRYGTMRYSNQVLVTCEQGYDKQSVLDACVSVLSENVNVTSSQLAADTTAGYYVNNFVSTLGLSSRLLPCIFYLVMLFVVVMFLNQMVTQIAREIGIMLALGYSKSQVVNVVRIVALITSLGGTLFGLIVGIALSYAGSSTAESVLTIPDIPVMPDLLTSLVAIVVAIAVGQVAATVSARKILKMTPKEAISGGEEEEGKTRKLPRFLASFSPQVKLSFNIALRNPKRIALSIFSLTASITLILLGFLFVESIDDSLKQYLEKTLNYDYSFVSTDTGTGSTLSRLKALDGVTDVEEVLYAQATFELNGKTKTGSVEGLTEHSTLKLIPDEDGNVGNVDVEGEGVWITRDVADALNAQPGDTITVNGTPIVVRGITFKYFARQSDMGATQFKKIFGTYTTGYFLNVSSRTALDSFLVAQDAAVITDRAGLTEDMHARNGSLYLIAYLVAIFGVLMALITISMMSRSSIQEQKRLVSTLRILGFDMIDISHIWSWQETVYLIISCIIGVPLGLVATWAFARARISESNYPPFSHDPILILLGVAIVVVTVVVAHKVSIRVVGTWNLADNTRGRE